MKRARPRFPFPAYPNGWFAVSTSADLPAGAVRPLEYFGRDLVLFRTASGEARVLDAICPHLGAHLGHAGTTDGETIRCPFHGWRFDGSGACVRIPYASKIPPRAKVTSYPVCERNGVVMMYFHHAGAPPSFEVPFLADFQSDEWTTPRVLRWKIRSRNQEIMENVIDAAHFEVVHRMEQPPKVAATDIVDHTLHVKFYEAPGTDIDVTLYGLGFQLVQDHTGMGIGRGNTHATFVTPIDDEWVDMLQLLTVKRFDTEAETKRMEDLWHKQVFENLERDILIWNTKAFIASPLLVEGDGPIPAMRRWAQQFYEPSAAAEA